MDKSLTQFNFSQQEHVTSIKLNNMLSILDEMRRLSGPMSIAEATSGVNTPTVKHVKLVDHPNDIGGMTISGTTAHTRATFTVHCNIWSDTPDDPQAYVRWEGVVFESGGSDWAYEWYTILNDDFLASGDIGAGANAVNVNTTAISSFTFMREPVITGSRNVG